MPISLHAAYVPSALQMLGTAGHLINTAEKWCKENEGSEADIIGAKIYDDMLPWCYQVKCVAEHTQGSVEGVRAGVYSPDLNPPPTSFDAIQLSTTLSKTRRKTSASRKRAWRTRENAE